MRRLRMALSIMAVLIVVMSTTVALTFAMWLFLPRETKQPLRLRIPYRATMRDVLNLLERDGWSHPRWLFRRVAHKLDIPRRLQAGEFVIEPPVSRWRLMQALRQQRPHLISVTIRS
ncbi:MAG TPA: hypothetical protein EYP10_13205, partial [Armatimonadetes bacterium]|nr:hypothetical protein [Armatimonadota bacterium]